MRTHAQSRSRSDHQLYSSAWLQEPPPSCSHPLGGRDEVKLDEAHLEALGHEGHDQRALRTTSAGSSKQCRAATQRPVGLCRQTSSFAATARNDARHAPPRTLMVVQPARSSPASPAPVSAVCITAFQNGATSSDQSVLRTSHMPADSVGRGGRAGNGGRCAVHVWQQSTRGAPHGCVCRGALQAGGTWHARAAAHQTACGSLPRCTTRAGSRPRRCGPAATAPQPSGTRRGLQGGPSEAAPGWGGAKAGSAARCCQAPSQRSYHSPALLCCLARCTACHPPSTRWHHVTTMTLPPGLHTRTSSPTNFLRGSGSSGQGQGWIAAQGW